MNSIEYRKSNKKIIIISMICAVVLTFLVLLALQVKDEDLQLLFIATSAIATGIICLLAIKRAKSAHCPHCKSDLYNVIDRANIDKLPVYYCPNCGAQIEI